MIAPNARDRRGGARRAVPGVPVIGFPKGAGAKLPAYARETGVDAVGLDETVDPLWAARELPAGLPVQGNLDPLLLLAGGAALEARRAAHPRALSRTGRTCSTSATGSARTRPIAHVEQLLARGARLAGMTAADAGA